MIAYIQGKVLEKQLPMVVIDVMGLGYELETSLTTFYQLPEVGQVVRLHAHLLVREDAQLLYGFYDKAERSLFRLLLKVSGVGAKLALAILSSIETNQFIQCIEQQDTQTLVRIPGVGKKTAERLIIEMRDRLKQLDQSLLHDAVSLPGQQSASLTTTEQLTATGKQQEALTALLALGYKPAEATRALKQIETQDSVEAMIRLALKGMVKA